MKRLLLAACLACGFGATHAATLPASACPDPLTTSPGGGINNGINVGRAVGTGPTTARAALGTGWSRMALRWNDIKPTSGGWSWTEADALVKAHSGTGLKVLAVINGPKPRWETGDYSSPTVQADWAAFASAVVERYSGNTPDPGVPGSTLPRIAAFEIWNEPNAANGIFGGTLAQYHDYLLKPAVDAIRISANATAFLVAPAMATNQYFVAANEPATRANVKNALDQALGTRAGGNLVYVDAVSVHAYLAPVHTMMMGSGVKDWLASQTLSLPVYLSEFGKNSDQCAGPGLCETGEIIQVCAFRNYQNRNINTPTFDVTFWFNFIDQDGVAPSGVLKQFGVLAVNGDCKNSPATSNYYSKWIFADMQRQFGVTPTVAHYTPYSCN
ncbi:hypothetical protein D0B54_14125 [Solimonas sp. K1W22B-7]|uniref:hypothetical protein n=1 Tax=Solimonas sp. K1W22B-7 TaxID=2303331 RepID=UPI000E32D95C|nr:hypothetical protein [Solimonas sp. K1W22B-7]AXQ29740.1 hypothetical protein D0B54_14125 [Solimonas sp. K1W22B-7]